MEEYAKKENKPINEVNQESVNQFVEEGVNIYNGKVHNVMISTIGLRVSLIKKMTNILLIVSIVLLGILMLCLYFASGRYKHVFVRNVAYLVTSTGLLLVSFTMILSINNPLTHLSIIDDHMKKWITESIKLLMTVQIVVSIVFLVLGILLSLYSYKEYKKLEQRGFRRKQQTFDEIEGY